jgi:hypothetical protein
MLQPYCIKNIFLLYLSTLFWNGLSAQNKVIPIPFHPLIANTDTAGAGKFVVVSAAATVVNAEQKGQLNVLRQLNDSVYVIQTKDTGTLNSFKKIYPANNKWKLSPALLNKKQFTWPATFLFSIQNENAFNEPAVNSLHAVETATKDIYLVKLYSQAGLDKLLNDNAIIFISEYHTNPAEELQINTLDLSVNKINLLHNKSPLLNGNGLVVSIKENKPDTTDIDLAGRFISNPLAATTINSHATIMATMAAGAGNSYHLGKGVAWGASITSSSFSNLLPDPDANYAQNNITVQNHSYGVGVENFYGADAAAYDASALANDKLVFIFSAGNSGTSTPATGNYAGIAGTANLTGSFKMAKNIITVGAVDSFSNVVAPSSKGPAYDGRIKPEMVAYGEDGSSGAAALVSGTALVLQQVYKNNNGGALPPSSLVKAILLNSADDVAAPGIDFNSGFGNLNTYKAVEGMSTQKYFTGTVSNNGSQTFSITIPPNISKAKFTLVWNDVPAAANAFKAIKNDLDIQLQSNATSQIWLPWVLNSFAHKDSLALLPARKRDSLNIAEQISIDAPAPGNYSIIVNGFNVTTPGQAFAIAYQFDTADVFTWVYPGLNDNIFPAAANVLRWQSTFAPGTAALEYSINNGASWLPITGTINTAAKFFKWNAPDTTAIALLRITIGSQQFISDLFTISAKPDLNIGFNCSDSVMLYWNKNKGITNYQLYVLGNKYLQQFTTIADTQFVFNKNSVPYVYFAVAPVINNRTGVKSYATDYSKQGVDCYIKNLLADLLIDKANISLTIGTTYQVKKIVFEKQSGNSFIPLSEITIINGLNYATTDINLKKGVNSYRVALYLLNGKIIYSDVVSIIYFNNKEILIYPDPVIQNSTINIQLKFLRNQVLSVIDAAGRKLLQEKIVNTNYSLPARFAKGLYIISVYDPENNSTQFFKIIIQ